MRDYDLDQWLAGTEVTDEQRAALHAASDAADTLYPTGDPGDEADREAAFTDAAMLVLGDTTLEDIGDALEAARAAEAQAMKRAKVSIAAAAALGVSEVEIARRAGLNRLTVRAALGK